jgi:ABC-2 type transport system ATP-binding protein
MVIKVKDLVKRYGEVLALDQFSLELSSGEILGLLGPNGSGKTTAINCMLALLKYDQGEIELFGRPMKADSYELKKDIGVVMQNVALFEALTAEENIDYFCGLYVADKKQRREMVRDAIEFVGLQGFERFRPKKLSGGLLRRLNIACGIAHRPRLIFLDEPTVAVDPQSRNRILEGIVELKRRGATIVYTSHYMEEVERICSRIMILDRGRVIASGTRDSLKKLIDLGEKNRFEISDLEAAQMTALRELPGVASVSLQDGLLEVRSHKGAAILETLLAFFKEKGIVYGKIYSEQPSLNDVFLEITGRELRDELNGHV